MEPEASRSSSWPRREILRWSVAVAGTATFGRALVSLAEGRAAVDATMIRQAEWISGLELTDEDRELMLGGVNELLDGFNTMRGFPLEPGDAPALTFLPAGGERASAQPVPAVQVRPSDGSAPALPSAAVDVAFAPVHEQAVWIRERAISSVELTRLYLERLERFDPQLACVITLTRDLALEQAERADREIAAGRRRGPLHGIPWGAKDLLAVPGYRTTWGAKPYEDQVLNERATVAARLADAGAVLVAKLSLGALAWGDVWFGGTTRNPWNLEQGSSGSSAGSAAATAAGLVGFAIGSETWGSIVSPCTRCGATGLRPTFGRVSRHGAMPLSWSMDKLGPIARSVEDCALVFGAIAGPDGLDPSVVDRPFRWPLGSDPRTLRVGFVEALFDGDPAEGLEDEAMRERAREGRRHDLRTLETLREIGVKLVPIRLPQETPIRPLASILTAEAATAFDDLTRSGRDDLLVRQVEAAWPNEFRQGQLIPAVEYLRANRIRSRLIRETEACLAAVDAYVCPSFGGDNLLLTNLTGHPAVVLPNGFRESDGTPTSITFNGRLFGETALLAVAHAYQRATSYHLERPPVGGAD